MKEKTCVGMVAEYNPFHNGHLYHLQESKRITGAEVSVAVMSGNFMQRGELAVADKWSRAEMAVRNGVDLVVELPVVFGCNSAGYFARAGVEILESLGADWISFGSETGDLEGLTVLAEKMEAHEAETETRIKELVKEGLAYPRARQTAMEGLNANVFTDGELDILGKPNTILALEYLKCMKSARPVTVHRQGPGYHEDGGREGFASASWIREQLARGKEMDPWLPEETLAVLFDPFYGPSALAVQMQAMKSSLFRMAAQEILKRSAEELDLIAAGGEGLGNKAKNEIRYCRDLDELIEKLKSKRYTQTRISRFIAQILLGVTGDVVQQARQYVRVLAFNEKGSQYLKMVKKEGCRLPIITNINREAQNYPEIQGTLEKDILAADLYNLTTCRPLYYNSDFVKMPVNFNER